MKTVGEVGEANILRWLAETFGAPADHVQCGIGDDAAVFTCGSGQSVVTSTDTIVEGVDFLPAWASFTDIGHKAAAVNLSDLAAMGSTPKALLLTLALRSTDSVKEVKKLIRACHKLGESFGAPLLGGDLSATTGPLVVSVTALGEGRVNKLLYRHQGRPGDDIWVSGPLGLAAGGLAALLAGNKAPKRILQHQLRPTPRVKLGLKLGDSRSIRSCADISDGLVRDVLHLPEPGAGVRLHADQLHVDRALRNLAVRLEVDPLGWVLAGGEDFELVFCASSRKRASVAALLAKTGQLSQRVGEITSTPGLQLVGASDLAALQGFQHFS